MKLYYWKAPIGKGNFGDELNRLIWPHYLHGILDEDFSETFIGIGTLLNTGVKSSATNIVMGTGAGYGSLPDMSNSHWKIYCLRGPLSAEALKVDGKLGIIDPGVLINRLLDGFSFEKKWKYAYMPHWLNAGAAWESICHNTGWLYIDPLWDVETILQTLAQTECLITEAMHGAIVADAMNIPWIPVIDADNAHTLPFKWLDWCASVRVPYKPVNITGVKEMYQEHGNGSNAAAAIAEINRLFRKIERKIKPVTSKRTYRESQERKLEDVIAQFRNEYCRNT